MEVEESSSGNIGNHWWWALSSVVQLGWGIASYRKGNAGDCRLMPIKAFGVASLFVGSAASASVAFLHASGIHKMEDFNKWVQIQENNWVFVQEFKIKKQMICDKMG